MTVTRSNTVTIEDGGRTNMWATEPRMYIDQTAAERYGYETYAERAEKLNGRAAMPVSYTHLTLPTKRIV